jgi:hypothetical protein
MKTLIRQSGILAALVLALAQPARAVVNGGFETGDFTGWTLSGDTSFTGVGPKPNFEFVTPHSGEFAAYFGAPNAEAFLAQVVVPTTVGGTYSLDFWLQNLSSGSPNSFTASWGDGITLTPLLSLTNAPAFGYTGYSLAFTATTPATTIQFAARHTPSFWLLDDVSVSTVGVPDGATTAGLLAIALVGLGLVRRNRG